MKAGLLILLASLCFNKVNTPAPMTVLKESQEIDGRMLTIQDIRTIRMRKYIPPQQELSDNEIKLTSRDGSLYYGDSLVLKAEGNVTYGTVVSRNEFGCSEGIFPSPLITDSLGNSYRRWVFYCKDESAVRTFPLLDIRNNTWSTVKYPMNGDPSEKIKLGIFDPKKSYINYVRVTDFTDERYLTCVSWGGPNNIYVQVLDRAQHNMHLNLYSARTGSFIQTILTEHNDAWVEPQEPLHFINNYTFIYTTDNRDGYKNLYLANITGIVRRIARMDADMQFVAMSGDDLFFTANSPSPVENNLFCVSIENKDNVNRAVFGKPECLTRGGGWHTIGYVDGHVQDFCSSCIDPGYIHGLDSVRRTRVQLGYVPSADGKFKNYYRLVLPWNFDPAKKYPLLVYVYGGPHSQMVNDSYLANIRLWELYMAQRGYIVYVQDNRGTSCQGAKYEKAINRQCGKVEMEDQMVGIRSLLSQPWVDASRVGVHGWSYGGFMTLSLATSYPDIFKVAVCGGPVIDWRWYEVMYGERYMDNPQTNPEGFEATSLMNKAADLKAKTLIFQGGNDHTCLWQHSLSFIQKCIDAGVDIEYFPFPMADHNMTGTERDYLYSRISDFFIDNL